MTATTLHAPGWAPIGARDLKLHSRRYVRFGLALSGALHLLLLAGILWIQARVPGVEPRWNLTQVSVDLVPTNPQIDLPNEPIDRGYAPPLETENRIFKLVDDEIFVGDVPDATPVQVKWERRGDGSDQHPGLTMVHPSDFQDDPSETAVIAYEAAPVPTYRPDPVYPAWALEARIEGRVVLHVLVGRDGKVKRVNVRRNVLGLGDAAKDAIAQWVFRPALFQRKPVAVWVEIPVEFKLQGR